MKVLDIEHTQTMNHMVEDGILRPDCTEEDYTKCPGCNKQTLIEDMKYQGNELYLCSQCDKEHEND